MDQDTLKAMAAELAKGIKTEKDLSDLTTQRVKMTVETALSAELDDHLGHERHAPSVSGNTRNGSSRKTLKGDHGEVSIETPRDRDGSFSPQLVKKNQTRLTQMDDQILSLYAKGMTTRDIVEAFKEMYGADVSATLVSTERQKQNNRALASIRAIVEPPFRVVKRQFCFTKVRYKGLVKNSGQVMILLAPANLGR